MEASQERQVEIIRSELAAFFDCVPSQINYVLTTRFTPARGFLVESQRGSGGHVRIRRIYIAEENTLREFLLTELPSELTADQARHLCERLLSEQLISEREAGLMIAALSLRSLALPTLLRDQIRAVILRAMLLEIAQQTQG